MVFLVLCKERKEGREGGRKEAMVGRMVFEEGRKVDKKGGRNKKKRKEGRKDRKKGGRRERMKEEKKEGREERGGG